MSPFLHKRLKIIKGFLLTRFSRRSEAYDSQWWDELFYLGEISDARTIWHTTTDEGAAHHYASVELLICRHMVRSGRSIEGRVIDLGAGSGHWLDFYGRFGAKTVGIEVSAKATAYLKGKGHEVIEGDIVQVLSQQPEQSADLVNAIGVMVHLVDDAQWSAAIAEASRVLKPGGLFIVGGHFGWLDNLNVQWTDGRVNKRLRSARHWKRVLRDVGFADVHVYKNPAYLHLPEGQPENNVLVAVRLPRHPIVTSPDSP